MEALRHVNSEVGAVLLLRMVRLIRPSLYLAFVEQACKYEAKSNEMFEL